MKTLSTVHGKNCTKKCYDPYLGTISADTMSQALNLAAHYYERDSADLIAEEIS